MSPSPIHTGSETLDQLIPGLRAAVLDVRLAGKEGLRLQELGVIPGAPIEVLSQGQPMLVRVGELRLSLRRESAVAVSISPL